MYCLLSLHVVIGCQCKTIWHWRYTTRHVW